MLSKFHLGGGRLQPGNVSNSPPPVLLHKAAEHSIVIVSANSTTNLDTGHLQSQLATVQQLQFNSSNLVPFLE